MTAQHNLSEAARAARSAAGKAGARTKADNDSRVRADGYSAARGTIRDNVIRMPRERQKESWEIISEWAEEHGWGSYRLAGAMMLAATPEERKRLPESQTVLSGYWRRWLKGETIPDGSRSEENWRFRPIIARMMRTTPDMIWQPRKPAPETIMSHRKGSFGRDDPTGGSPVLGALKRRQAIVTNTLKEYQRELEYLQTVQQVIGDLQAELKYLDAVLSVPVPEDLPLRQAQAR